MMDAKMMAILQKAKMVEEAVQSKKGGSSRGNVDRSYFDTPEPNYTTQNPQGIPTGGSTNTSGGLFEQMGVGGGTPQSTPSNVVDRLSPDSMAYESGVNSSNMPEAIKKAMLDNPIPQPDGLGMSDIPQEFIDKINPKGIMNESVQPNYNDVDEKKFQHPISPDVRPREIPRTQPSVHDYNKGDIRKMIAEEIAKALPGVIEDYFDKRVIKENVQFKAGETTFSGTVSPLPKKKRTKRR